MRNRFVFIRRLLDSVPGRNTLGLYRFLPIFFGLGAALEFSMIKWDFNGQVNFYRTYKRRRAEEVVAILSTHPSLAEKINSTTESGGAAN